MKKSKNKNSKKKVAQQISDNTGKDNALSDRNKEKKAVNPPPKNQKEPQTMDELLQETKLVNFSVKKGEVVEGKIVSVSPREILIDIKRKSFGVVAEWEMENIKEYLTTLKAGDKVTAQVVSPENDLGFVVLSLRKASLEHRWLRLQEAKEQGLDIEVTGIETAKGGLLVDWQGLRGFIPATQLEGNFISNPAVLIGRKIKAKVLEVDKSLNRMVLSQKASALGVTPVKQKERLDKIKPDDVLEGTISGIAPFGVFVDVDGIEGLVHISEIAWEKVEDPSSMFKVGSKIEVMVLEVNKNEGKLNLSIKRLTPDPWKNILDRYPPEATISGKVVRRAPYGFFVQIEPGIEGLLHISKITPGEEPKIDQQIECMIENIDPSKRKISLTPIPKEKPVGYR